MQENDSREEHLRLITIKAAADRLGLKPVTVRAWVNQRRVAAFKFGRVWRISEEEIERLVAESFRPSRSAK